MERTVFDRPPVSEAVVDLLDDPNFPETPSATRPHPYLVPIAFVVFAAAIIVMALLSGVDLAILGS